MEIYVKSEIRDPQRHIYYLTKELLERAVEDNYQIQPMGTTAAALLAKKLQLEERFPEYREKLKEEYRASRHRCLLGIKNVYPSFNFGFSKEFFYSYTLSQWFRRSMDLEVFSVGEIYGNMDKEVQKLRLHRFEEMTLLEKIDFAAGVKVTEISTEDGKVLEAINQSIENDGLEANNFFEFVEVMMKLRREESLSAGIIKTLLVWKLVYYKINFPQIFEEKYLKIEPKDVRMLEKFVKCQ